MLSVSLPCHFPPESTLTFLCQCIIIYASHRDRKVPNADFGLDVGIHHFHHQNAPLARVTLLTDGFSTRRSFLLQQQQPSKSLRW